MGLHVSEMGTRGESGHKRGVGGEGVEADPGIDRRASPGGIDDPDGNVFAPVDLAGEKVGDGEKSLAVAGVHGCQTPEKAGSGESQEMVRKQASCRPASLVPCREG